MIDVTKEIPIKKEFLERVLNSNKRGEILDEDIENMSLEEIERLLGNDSDYGISSREITGVSGREVDEYTPWWLERDKKGEVMVPDFDKGELPQKIALAPFHLIRYVGKSIERNNKTKRNDILPFLDTSFKVFGLAGAFSAVMMAYDLDFIVKSYNMAFVTGGIAAASIVASTIIKAKKGDDYEISDIEKSYLESGDDDKNDIEEIDDYCNYTEKDNIKDVVSNGEDYQEEISLKKKIYSQNLPIPQNSLSIETSFNDYTNMLKYAFESSSMETKKRYGRLTNREEIVASFSNYIICNNAGFSESTPIAEGSTVYNNLNFLLYEGLRGVYTNLTYTGEYTMEVKSLVETQLYYKLEVELPKMVKLDKLVKDISILEGKLKSHEADSDVGISVSSYGNTYVFRIKKASNVVVTWGDAIRYYDPETGIKTYEDYMDEKKYVLPILVGLHNEESPVIFDVAKNTSIAVAGTSGSGKSWAVYLLLFNMLIQSHPGDISLIILDFKRDTQYRAIARLPHVVGYHHEIDKYMDYIREVVAEMNRRKELLDQLGVSKWEELRANLKDDPDKLHNFPWLFVIVEETAAVLSTLETEGGKENKDEFILLLKQIAKQGRSLGLRIVMISQRTTANELPRDIESECGVKFTFKLKDADLERVEMKPSGVQSPTKKGMAMFKEEYLTEPVIIKSLGIGGMDDEQILNLTRMLAFEWHCRIDDEFNSQNFPLFKITDNRKIRREEVLKDLENEDYFFDLSKVDFTEILNKLNGNINKLNGNTNEKVVYKKESENLYNTQNKVKEEIKYEYIDLDKIIDNEQEKTGVYEGINKEIKDYKKEEKSKNKISSKVNTGMMGYRKTVNNPELKDNKNIELMNHNEPQINDETKYIKQRTITEFIHKYGGNTGGSYIMNREILKMYYSDYEIDNAASNLEIVLDGDNYLA